MKSFGYLKQALRSEIWEKCIKDSLSNTRKGMWKKLFEILKGDANFEWLIIDSTYVKYHQYLCCARGKNQAISKTKLELI